MPAESRSIPLPTNALSVDEFFHAERHCVGRRFRMQGKWGDAGRRRKHGSRFSRRRRSARDDFCRCDDIAQSLTSTIPVSSPFASSGCIFISSQYDECFFLSDKSTVLSFLAAAAAGAMVEMLLSIFIYCRCILLLCARQTHATDKANIITARDREREVLFRNN